MNNNNIIDLGEYLKNRTKRSKDPEDLDDVMVAVVKYKDPKKTSMEYELTGEYLKSKTGRIVAAKGLFAIVEDILRHEDPAIVQELIDEMKYNPTEDEDD